MKTPEEKREYCKKWRVENREKYLAQRRAKYQENKEGYREASKKRAHKYYHEVHRIRRASDPAKYKALDRVHSQKVYQARKRLLAELRMERGGKCSFCQYDTVPAILQFHHPNDDKEGDVSSIQGLAKIRLEAAKCVLLCPNCHAITHLT
jgi:hypothetical protein